MIYGYAAAAIAGFLASWIALPRFVLSGILLTIAGLLQTIRYSRWAGDRTLGNRLVLVLHAAHAFVPIGFVLIVAAFAPSSALLCTAGSLWFLAFAGFAVLFGPLLIAHLPARA